MGREARDNSTRITRNYRLDVGGRHEVVWQVEEISEFFTQNRGSNNLFLLENSEDIKIFHFPKK